MRGYFEFNKKLWHMADEAKRCNVPTEFWRKKESNRELLDFLQQFGERPSDAYWRYKEETNIVTDQFLNVVHECKELGHGVLYNFSKHLKRRGFYSHELTFANKEKSIAVSRYMLLKRKSFLKYKEIIKEWEKYKKEMF